MKIEKLIEHSIVQEIVDAATLIKKNGSLISAQIDLTTQQWMILLLLSGDPNHPYIQNKKSKDLMASDIADALGVSRPNVTNLINSLVDKDLVTQEGDSYDRRKRVLKLTSKASGYLSAIEALRIDANQRLLQEFTEEEKMVFLSFLKRCTDYLTKEQEI